MKTQNQITGALKCFVVAFALLTVVVAKAADTNAPTATLIFTGMTNSSSGKVARFVLTNGTSAHVVAMPIAFEYQTNNVWKQVPLLGNNYYRLIRRWTGLPEELRAGRAASFIVPPPYTNCNWRLIFNCQEQRPIIDTAHDTVRHFTATNAVQKGTRQFSGRHYLITSPEVPTQPTAPAH